MLPQAAQSCGILTHYSRHRFVCLTQNLRRFIDDLKDIPPEKTQTPIT